MLGRSLLRTATLLLLGSTGLHAQNTAPPYEPRSSLAVREVCVFKDGRVFVKRHGTMPTDEQGRVVMDELPVPVMGTLWPCSGNEAATLRAVTAASRSAVADPSVLSLRERLTLNQGGEAFVAEKGGDSYFARVGELSPVNSLIVTGNADSPATFAGHDGLGQNQDRAWWHWSSWPQWWTRFTGIGRVTWNVRLEPEQTQKLDYAWHDYWR